MSDLEFDRKYHHGRMQPIARKSVTHFVWINEVEHRYDELLGYIEGLRLATADKPMPIYNDAIEAQLLGDKIAEMHVADHNGKPTHMLVCINEEHRAEFEKEMRGLVFNKSEED